MFKFSPVSFQISFFTLIIYLFSENVLCYIWFCLVARLVAQCICAEIDVTLKRLLRNENQKRELEINGNFDLVWYFSSFYFSRSLFFFHFHFVLLFDFVFFFPLNFLLLCFLFSFLFPSFLFFLSNLTFLSTVRISPYTFQDYTYQDGHNNSYSTPYFQLNCVIIPDQL